MDLYITYTETRISSARGEGDYADWRDEYYYSVDSAFISPPNRKAYEEIGLDFEIKVGDKLYVLWATYSTGDSFGMAYGQGEIIWVFSDKSWACNAKDIIQLNRKEPYVEIIVDGDKAIRIGNIAFGYFDSLDSTYITELVVQP